MFYQRAYPDLRALSKEKALEHWNTRGRDEGRFFTEQEILSCLPRDFDVEIYRKLNPDLQNLTRENLLVHYHAHGRKENRKYSLNLKTFKEYPFISEQHKYDVCDSHFLTLKNKKGFYTIRIDEGDYKLVGITDSIQFIFTVFDQDQTITVPIDGTIELYASKKLSILEMNFYPLFENKNLTSRPKCIFHVHGREPFLDLASNLMKISKFMDVIISISDPSLISEITPYQEYITMIVPIVNGSDINGMIKILSMIPESDILFFHTKSNPNLRQKWASILFGSEARIRYGLEKVKNGCVGVGEEFLQKETNPDCFVSNMYYLEKLCQEYNIPLVPKDLDFFGGSYFYLSERIVKFLQDGNLQKLYTYYCPNEFSVDVNWYAMENGIDRKDVLKVWHEKKNKGSVYFSREGTRDGCFPHAFERFIGYLTKYLDQKFIKMTAENLIKSNDIIPTAIYFPQFHPFEENDLFWGRGFTEWTFLRDTKPLISTDIIYQPLDGYYDLRELSVRQKESRDAFYGGIEAFCYYHYWFSGKKVMYQVLENMLKDGYPAQKFYLAWANEPWSRRWDGMTTELLPQEYGTEKDWINHFLYLEQFFRDERYIKIDGCPILAVLRVGHMTCFREMVSCWKEIARKMGYPDLKIIGFLTSFPDSLDVFNYSDLVSHTTERQPSYCNLKVPNPSENSLKQLEHTSIKNIFQLRTGKPDYDEESYLHFNLDIKEAVSAGKLENGFVHYKQCPEHERISRTLPYYYLSNQERWKSIENMKSPENNFRGTFVHWNNTPRNRGNLNWRATIHYDFVLEKFTQHLINMFFLILKEKKAGTYPFLFNAWNEWNEQSILQPNTIYKYQILECVKSAVNYFN